MSSDLQLKFPLSINQVQGVSKKMVDFQLVFFLVGGRGLFSHLLIQSFESIINYINFSISKIFFSALTNKISYIIGLLLKSPTFTMLKIKGIFCVFKVKQTLLMMKLLLFEKIK